MNADENVPLEIQDAISSSKSYAIFLATTYIVVTFYCFYLIATSTGAQETAGYSGLYGIIALLHLTVIAQLSKKSTLGAGTATRALAILGVFSAISIVGIFIDIQLWKNANKISKFNKHGAKLFSSDIDWRAKHKKAWSDRHQSITAVVGGLVISMVFVGFAIVGNLSTSGTSAASPTEIAAEGVAQEKAGHTFPMSTSSQYVTITDITSDGPTIQYHSQIKGADTSNITTETLRSGVKSSICSNKDLLTSMKSGVNLQYIYTVSETGQNYTFTIGASDCA